MDTLKHLSGVNLNPYVQLTFQKGKTKANKSAVDLHSFSRSVSDLALNNIQHCSLIVIHLMGMFMLHRGKETV